MILPEVVCRIYNVSGWEGPAHFLRGRRQAAQGKILLTDFSFSILAWLLEGNGVRI